MEGKLLSCWIGFCITRLAVGKVCEAVASSGQQGFTWTSSNSEGGQLWRAEGECWRVLSTSALLSPPSCLHLSLLFSLTAVDVVQSSCSSPTPSYQSLSAAAQAYSYSLLEMFSPISSCSPAVLPSLLRSHGGRKTASAATAVGRGKGQCAERRRCGMERNLEKDYQ